MSTKTIADFLDETLADIGVERIWGVTGRSWMVLDSLRRLGGVRWIHTQHEQVTAFAAGGEAAVTGNPATCAEAAGREVSI